MERIYPTMIYTCPVTNKNFGTKKYCEATEASLRINKPFPCPYYKGVEHGDWGPSVNFDVILCHVDPYRKCEQE